MATKQAMHLSRGRTTPVILWWSLDDGSDVPQINVTSDRLRQEIFDEYEADSVEELSESVLSPYQSQRMREIQLGLVLGQGEDATYITETEALSEVEGIDEELADHLIDWFNDIPSMCREIREDKHLGAMYNDVYVEADSDEEAEWVENVEAGPGLERRIKKAGVWVEPNDVVAH